MFSSKKDSAPAAAPSVPPLKRAARSSAPSIISADLVVNGTLTSTGDIQIDGRVEGDVHSAGLVVGDKAFIHGEIMAEEITIRGRVQGSVRARKVLLCSTSHVEGNILHEAFAVETGAFFEGNCRHADNPLADDPAKRIASPAPSTPAAAPAPPPAPAPAFTTVTRPMPTSDARPAAAATFAPLKTGA
ncbi:MAG: polymer-forming cytoskeletal protein [Alphaproteobacteria bacterium]|nr:polymer-forming cytoskeletal protein [Alphaproteobacteria bacterium]MBL6939297.1 polymer-forming cytoskeletal protein [Alphaproteobacteria bacterium]MBL7096813.1 polymer-forming cytoskeletal protein [Alphaproteobacteria bacterium]